MIAWPLLTAVYEHSGHRDSYQNLPTLALSRPLLLIPTTSDTPKPLSGSVGYSLPWLDMDLKPTTLHTHGFSCGHPWASLASRGFLPLAAQRPSPHHPNLLSPGESVLGTLFLLFSVYCTSSTLTAFKTTLTLALLIVHVARVPWRCPQSCLAQAELLLHTHPQYPQSSESSFLCFLSIPIVIPKVPCIPLDLQAQDQDHTDKVYGWSAGGSLAPSLSSPHPFSPFSSSSGVELRNSPVVSTALLIFSTGSDEHPQWST